MSAGAEEALNGQVLHLIGIIHGRGLHVVPIADDEPGPAERQVRGWSLTQVGCGPMLVYRPSSRVLPGQALPSHQDIPSPVVILCQGNLFKVQVQPLALRSLQQPVAGEVVAVVAREARRDNAASGGIADHSTAGSCVTGTGPDWILGSLTSLSARLSSVPYAWGSTDLFALMVPKVNPLLL